MTNEEVSKVTKLPKMRPSNSFTEVEVKVMITIAHQLLKSGGSVSPAVLRNPAYSSLVRKFQNMDDRLKRSCIGENGKAQRT